MVSNTKYVKYKMFGTKLEFKNGEWQGPCLGDNGGPLMYQDPASDRWVIIGINWISNTKSVWQLLSGTHQMSPARGWKWKWSNGVGKSEMDLFWCISMANNVKSYKKSMEESKLSDSVFSRWDARPRSSLLWESHLLWNWKHFPRGECSCSLRRQQFQQMAWGLL